MSDKKTPDSQRRASEKWKEKNRDRNRYINQRSAARSFIRLRATPDDLEELTQMALNKQVTSGGNSKMKTIYYQIQQYVDQNGRFKPNNKVIEATLVDANAKTWASSAIPAEEFDDSQMIDANFIPSVDQEAIRDELTAKGYSKINGGEAQGKFFKQA